MLIEELLEKLVADGGSDLHISSGLPPAARIEIGRASCRERV